MTSRTIKDAIRHRSPRITATLKTIQRRLRDRKSPYAALDRAHSISAILGPGTRIEIDARGVWLRDRDGCYWRHVPHVYGPFLGLERGGGFESSEVSWAIEYLQAGAYFVDIGANIGAFSVNVARHTNHTSALALEPVGQTFDSLAANIARNDLVSRIKPLRLAVGDHRGHAIVTSGLNAANHVVPRLREQPCSGEEAVEQETLDHLVEREGVTRLDLVKLDVEGFELSVLNGASSTLRRFRPAVIMEIENRWTDRYDYRPTDIFAFLRSLDYKHYYFGETGLTKGSEDATSDLAKANNYLFLPQGLAT